MSAIRGTTVILTRFVRTNLSSWLTSIQGLVYCVLKTTEVRCKVAMGELGILICPICLICWYSWYSASWIGQITRLNRFDSWFARLVYCLRDSYFTNHRQIGANIMNKQIHICLIRTNQMNIYLFIRNICLIRPANRWLICSICSIYCCTLVARNSKRLYSIWSYYLSGQIMFTLKYKNLQ